MYISDTDIELLKAINLNRNISLDFLFNCITNSASIVAYGVPLIILLIGLMNANLEQQKNALAIIGYALLAALIATLIKYGLNRPRPFITYPILQSLSDGGSPSFPSGHTCDAFVVATSISIIYKKWFVIIPVFLWAFAVAYSRMHLGVHYPSDVLGGILVGSGVPLILCAIKTFKQKKRSV